MSTYNAYLKQTLSELLLLLPQKDSQWAPLTLHTSDLLLWTVFHILHPSASIPEIKMDTSVYKVHFTAWFWAITGGDPCSLFWIKLKWSVGVKWLTINKFTSLALSNSSWRRVTVCSLTFNMVWLLRLLAASSGNTSDIAWRSSPLLGIPVLSSTSLLNSSNFWDLKWQR